MSENFKVSLRNNNIKKSYDLLTSIGLNNIPLKCLIYDYLNPFNDFLQNATKKI